MGRAESSITRLEGTAAIAALEKFDAGPAMPAFFCTSSVDCHCEKFVTELSARPTSGMVVLACDYLAVDENQISGIRPLLTMASAKWFLHKTNARKRLFTDMLIQYHFPGDVR